MTSDWQVHRKQPSRYSNDVDYKKLNKLAPKNRVTTSQGSYRFRQSNKSVMTIPDKVIVHPQHNRKPSLQVQMSLDPECAYSFGMPNKPSTPIRTVICGTYGNVAEYDQLNRNASIKKEQK